MIVDWTKPAREGASAVWQYPARPGPLGRSCECWSGSACRPSETHTTIFRPAERRLKSLLVVNVAQTRSNFRRLLSGIVQRSRVVNHASRYDHLQSPALAAITSWAIIPGDLKRTRYVLTLTFVWMQMFGESSGVHMPGKGRRPTEDALLVKDCVVGCAPGKAWRLCHILMHWLCATKRTLLRGSKCR
jgi:hypothetical protein